jgi:hypothetical protein
MLETESVSVIKIDVKIDHELTHTQSRIPLTWHTWD